MNEMGLRVLVVDDERPIRRYLRAALNAQGYLVYEAATGQEALQAVLTDRPDLIILDLGLPDLDGVEVTRRLREWNPVPILILSVREHEQDKVAALDAGADDYLTKPFGTGELLARMRVALRRAAQSTLEPVIQVEALTVDISRRLVSVAGREVSLTPTEYDLLVVGSELWKFTHWQLLPVWGVGYEGVAPAG
jgi:two-component system KDP operon response regulator KdpE